jgi:hypothetical protein
LEKLKRGEISSASDAEGEEGESKPKKKRATAVRKKRSASSGSEESDVGEPVKKASAGRGQKTTASSSQAKLRAKKAAATLSDSETPAAPKKRGRPPKASIATACKTAGLAKGKGRALSPVSDLSSGEDDDAEARALFLDEAELANSEANSDLSEASDEERELAYAAAADGSLEMQRGDISPTSSSTTTHGGAEAISQSPPKRRKKASAETEVISPDKQAKTTVAARAKKPVQPIFVEISDSD